MACSKYTITNSSSILTNFNYRRCDDSLWEYQAELGPSETKNIWTIDGTYSTAFANDIVIDNSTEFPITPTPEASNQTGLVLALNQNNSWSYGILNFTNESVIGNIDLGISLPYGDNGGIHSFGLNESGYGVVFDNFSVEGVFEYQFICINSLGSVVDRYHAVGDTDENFTYGNQNGIWTYFDDNQSGVLKFFNGSYIGTFNYDSTNQSISVIGTMSTGSLVILLSDSTGNTQTVKLLAPGGIENTVRVNDTTSGGYINAITNPDGDFIAIIDTNDGVNYSSFEIYNSSGTTLLQNISLTGGSYIDLSIIIYGNNKITLVLFDDSGPGEHYVINYNGNTNTLLTTTEDAVLYPTYLTYSKSNTSPTVSPSENMYILFIGQYTLPVKSLWAVRNSKILSFIDESPTILSYTFQNSGNLDKSMGWDIVGISNTLFMPVNSGNGLVSMLSLNESGHTITSTGLPISGITDIDVVTTFGDNCYMRIVKSGTCSDNVFVYGNDGLLRDSLSGGTFDGYSVSYNTLWLRSLGSGCVSSYYINNQNSGFTETDIFFGAAYNQSACYIPNFTYNGAILMYDDAALIAKIITPSSVSETFQIKTSNYIRGGTNYFMDLDEISGSTIYDFNGNIINTNNQQGDFTCENYCYGAVDSRYFYSNIVGSNSIFNLSGIDNNRNFSMYTNSGTSFYIQLNDSIYNQF